jgi:hypothetical protein
MPLYRYRIWCDTDNQYEYVWSSELPTECPTDAGHTIDTSKISRIGVKNQSSFIEQTVINQDVKQTSYKTVGEIIHLGIDDNGQILEAKVIAYKDSGVTSYDVRIVDKENGSVVICEATGLTNDEKSVVDLGTISNQPDGESIFEVQIKKTGGNGNERVHLNTVLIKY